MEIDDVGEYLGAVERTVSSLERDGKPTRAVTMARSYKTTVEDIWDAVTSDERLPRWFLPISGELKLGGRYQLEGNAGGLITACERPTYFAVTWEFGGDTSWVDVRIAGDGAEQARLTLTHTAHLSDHWNQYGPGATGVGWELGLIALRLHLAEPGAPRMDEAAFFGSPVGKAFIVGSSERWGQASILAGTDNEAALAAAGRTTAFYTGEAAESS